MPRKKRTYSVVLRTPKGKETWKVKLARLPANQHEKVYGLCSYEKKTITIDDRHDFKTILQTAIHEASHSALGPDLSESAIERIEHNVFAVAWLFLEDKLDMED